jgi:hypothetical protein
MATWEKTGSAWFGDTFNRDATLCYAVASSDKDDDYTASAITSVAKSINSYCDGEISFTTLNNLVDKIGVNSVDVNISSSVDSLTDKLQEIQKRLNALESKPDRAPKVTYARLRPLLKTLNYEREVQ